MGTWSDKDFEEKMTIHIDNIYKGIFKDKLVSIFRSEREKNQDKRLLFMDIELSIDTHLTFKNGSILTFQEKSRRNQYMKFNDFTFEYYNDPKKKLEGEWFKLASQLYFYGYSDAQESKYLKYWIINVARLRTGLLSMFTIEEMEQKFMRYNEKHGKASFFGIPFRILESIPNVVVFKHPSNKQISIPITP